MLSSPKSIARNLDPPMRPKDAVKEYLGYLASQTSFSLDTQEEVAQFQHLLFDFAYWMEGQDLILDDDLEAYWRCRYHIVPAHESPCPFGKNTERIEIEHEENSKRTQDHV